jgi:asparagine synthase (glutamine-hydrolysing)
LLKLPLAFGKGRHLLSDVPAKTDIGSFAHWWRRVWNGAMLREFNLPAVPIEHDSSPELPDEFARISWSELRHYMRDVLLRDSDQMSMAVSLEVRVPFLDHELVEFVLGLPESEKNQGPLVKSLLVDSVKDLLPSEIYDRKKMGFQLPMDDWMRGPLDKFTTEGLRHVVDHDVFTDEQASRLRRQFSGRKLHWQKLWAVVVLGWYLKKQDQPVRL